MWRRELESGRVIWCFFCADCGTRLFHNPERNPQATIVKPGTLDDTTWLAPVGHIWTRSAQPWVPIPSDTVNYEGQPPDLSRLVEAWRAHGLKGQVSPGDTWPVCASVPMADRQFLGREQRDHAAALVGHHHLLLDAGGGVAVGGGAVGLEREHHALLDFGRMVDRDHARD